MALAFTLYVFSILSLMGCCRFRDDLLIRLSRRRSTALGAAGPLEIVARNCG